MLAGKLIFFEARVVIAQQHTAFQKIRRNVDGALVKTFDVLVFIDRGDRLRKSDHGAEMPGTEFERPLESTAGLRILPGHKQIISQLVLDDGQFGSDFCSLQDRVFLPGGCGIDLPSENPIEGVGRCKLDGLIDLLQDCPIPAAEIVQRSKCIEPDGECRAWCALWIRSAFPCGAEILRVEL